MSKPVAWVQNFNLEYLKQGYGVAVFPKKTNNTDIPLYTRPMRELRGDEIRTVIDEHWEKTSNVNLFDFARAILKKAQEK